MDDAPQTFTHGGARPGAGRPAGSTSKSEHAQRFDVARARKEEALAGLNELDLQVKLGNYLPRDAFREAIATGLAGLTSALRGIPDNIERTASVSPEVLEAISDQIDQALESLANQLKGFVDARPHP